MYSETWVIVGASRGIGLEFTKQLLEGGQKVIAGVRNPSAAKELLELCRSSPDRCVVEQCDVTSEESINATLCPQGSGSQQKWDESEKHCSKCWRAQISQPSNGNILCGFCSSLAHQYNWTHLESPPTKVVFISSDSGSATLFRSYEDGFAAYAASKAALNQMIRHMAAELARCEGKRNKICILAMHPGEVQTDMANIEVDWEVEGMIQADESVKDMLKVIGEKNENDSGTFWCWNGKVSDLLQILD
ncbi:hypothetical protein N7510_004271 [Penicillium lagena]|uniref:uncharacterized protein n=1 Tax=Penicillium lagena TaxID=94218 RepID=UPI002540ED31|nr:uncharacterized protein N7510_004271 [Penicillium lagena]KAJ5620287.1 hypothetical protein N7510_004271 [Penicillium lagena]